MERALVEDLEEYLLMVLVSGWRVRGWKNVKKMVCNGFREWAEGCRWRNTKIFMVWVDGWRLWMKTCQLTTF